MEKKSSNVFTLQVFASKDFSKDFRSLLHFHKFEYILSVSVSFSMMQSFISMLPLTK